MMIIAIVFKTVVMMMLLLVVMNIPPIPALSQKQRQTIINHLEDLKTVGEVGDTNFQYI